MTIAPWRYLPILASGLLGSTPREGPAIRVDFEAKPAVVEVVGIDPANRAALGSWESSSPRWPELFPLALAPTKAGQERPALPGSYQIDGETLRFTPKYPIEPALKHRATFRASRLPIPPAHADDLVLDFERPKPPKAKPTAVVRVDPSGEAVPENLLKLYLHFSGPMSRGEAYSRVAVLDPSGKKIDMPFLEIGEELWDPSTTRLTLLFDPGRIKKGLRPREEDGPILEAGKAYTFVVSRAWPDASGEPLADDFRKVLRVGPPEEARLDAKSWKVATPSAETRDPIEITFPRPLDRPTLDRAFRLLDSRGESIPGRQEIDQSEARWRFTPEQPWKAGDFTIRIDPTLEDLAGNSLARPFEVDLVRPESVQAADAKPVILPIAIRPPSSR